MIAKQALEKDLSGVATAMRCDCISLNPVEAVLTENVSLSRCTRRTDDAAVVRSEKECRVHAAYI